VSDGEATHRHLRLIKNDRADEPAPPKHIYPPANFAKMFDLSGKVALVVGGGGAIGGAIAHALADHGARIAIADVDIDSARRTAQSCARPTALGALAVQIDVTNPELIRQVVAAIEHETQRIDILVNAAGINIRKPVIDYTAEEWSRVLNVNLSGVFFVTQAVAKGMLQRGNGRVLNIGSVSSMLGHPKNAPYSATKGGIAIMTKSMATEWATRGITVNTIGPAYTETSFNAQHLSDPAVRAAIEATIPMGRLGTPQDVVGAAVFLCSDAAAFVTGQTLFVDGGRTAD
jgi:NAD(P)-dependent dehydrogenase (short-subunit alcohol dehydrogenase family)